MTKKIFALLLSVLMLCSALSGCITQYAKDPNETQAPIPTNAPAQNQGGEEAPAVSNEPVTLDVWYSVSGTSGEMFTAQSTAFDEGDDMVSLNLTYAGGSADSGSKISAALLTGNQPDVALAYAGPLYTGGEGDFRMADLIKQGGFDIDDVFSGMMDYCIFDGGSYCAIPYGISTQVMYYNKEILAAAGVDMTNPPKTWAEFKDVLQKCMESGNITGNAEFAAFDTSDEAWLFKSMLMQNGCEIIEMKDGTASPIYNNEKGVEVADYWYSLIENGYMLPSEHDNAENKFLGGNLAFIAASSNRISRWEGKTEFEIGAIEMPYFTQPSLALGGNVLIILTQDPAKIQKCWEYICYLTNVENNTEFALGTGYLPIHESALEQDAVKAAIERNEMYSVAFNQLQYTWAYTHFQQMGTMDIELRSMLNYLEKGRGTSQELLDKAAKNLQDEIDQG